ncbi:MAG: gluconate 2-dehydrogenase subunit 3 family protein [Bacteroidota bacterium]
MDRRAAVKRISAVVGVAITGPTMAGILSGCQPTDGPLKTLSSSQFNVLEVMSEHIIPETDTPGAKTAQVGAYIDAMLTTFYDAEEQKAFLDGLASVDAWAEEQYGKGFIKCDHGQQFALLNTLDRAAFLDEEEKSDNERAAHAQAGVENSKAFFRRLKILTVSGFYTSEVGATQELSVNPSGQYRGDVPFEEIGRAWS